MRTQRADHCPRPSARTGPTTKEWSEAESGSPSLYASWGANRQTEQVSGVIQLRSAVRCGPNERITAQDPALAQDQPLKSGVRQRVAVLLSMRPGVQTDRRLTTSFPVALFVRQYERLACGVHDGPSSGCLVIRLLPATLLSVAKHRLCLFHLSMGCVP
ncbi:hypothetical protein G5714_007712 [Onychostoma macrolepis]|uniref:Uncharacterized protein n=1 Tax=Onychostoma macrolepis TaxID=369639 RepID=A0A7J6CU81_9TELE|nr:hypothetical protein G5714_007712 [Onychostoma macrolepis]